MPPEKVSLKKRVEEYKDEGMQDNGGLMLCKFCNKHVEYTKSDTVKKHCSSGNHMKAKERAEKSAAKREHQPSIKEGFEGCKKRKEEKHEFIIDTVNAFLSANIPVIKLDNPAIRAWLHKYMKGSGDLPSSKVLRDEYIPEVAKMHENKIKEELKDKDIVIFSDETTDKGGRCVYNIMFQTLDPAPQQKLYLSASTVLDAANASTCANAVLDTLKRYEKNINDVVAFNSDSARYMSKCFKTLQGLNEDMIQIQCWPHKLHHVGNSFQETFPELNSTVKHVKKVFLNARKRKNSYIMFLQEKYPDNKTKWKGFPSPVVTRWNSWKRAVNYLYEHLDDVLQFLEDQEAVDDHNFEEECAGERTSGSIRWLKNLQRAEKERIKVYIEFVTLKVKGIEAAIQLFQSKRKPTAHLLYQNIDKIERSMALIMSENTGWFDDLPYFCSLSAAKQNFFLGDLQKAAKACRDTLIKYNSSDPGKSFYLALETLLSPRSLARSQLPAGVIKEHMTSLPFVKKLTCEEFMSGQAALMQMVKEEVNKPHFKNLDVVSLLCALKSQYLQFSNACLKALWILPSNANSERSISSYNIVVNDRRRKLKPENAESLTIVYFNTNEFNYDDHSPLDNNIQEEDFALTFAIGDREENNL